MERHQLGHQLLPVPLGGDAALLLAGGGQLPQDAEVHARFVVPHNGLLRVLQTVDEAAVQGGVFATDIQRTPHKIQQLAAGGNGGIGQILPLQHLVLGDLLHRHIFKAVPVKQVQRHILDAGAHLQCLSFAGGQRFFHSSSFGVVFFFIIASFWRQVKAGAGGFAGRFR